MVECFIGHTSLINRDRSRCSLADLSCLCVTDRPCGQSPGSLLLQHLQFLRKLLVAILQSLTLVLQGATLLNQLVHVTCPITTREENRCQSKMRWNTEYRMLVYYSYYFCNYKCISKMKYYYTTYCSMQKNMFSIWMYLKMLFLSVMAKLNFQHSSMSHDPSEIMLIWWTSSFVIIIINVERS